MLTFAAASLASQKVKEALTGGEVLQLLTGLSVTPGPNSATFTFKTRFASSPVIQVYKYVSGNETKDMTSQNLVTDNTSQLMGVPRKRSHNYRLPRPADWTPTSYPGLDEPFLAPLEQDSHYWFKITADSALNIAPAITIGRFWTSQRSATLSIEDLLVYQYGSSDFGSDIDDAVNSLFNLAGQSSPIQEYHINLVIGLYDQVNGLVDSVFNSFPSSVNNGDVPNPFPNQGIVDSPANDFVWLYSLGEGDPGTYKFGPFQGPLQAPDSPPAIPGHGDSDYGPYAEAVTQSRRLPDNVQEAGALDANPMLIGLESGPWGTSYAVTSFLTCSFVPPRHAPIVYASLEDSLMSGVASQEKAKYNHTHKLKATDDGVLAFTTPSKLHVLVPGAGNTLWSQTREAKSTTKTNTPWNKLGDGIALPITVLTNHDDKLDIFATGTEGNIYYAKLDGTASSITKTKWHNLGHKMTEEIAFVRTSKTLEIFVLDYKGAVSQGHVASEGKAPIWKSLGGDISTQLTALALPDGDIHVFGLDTEGSVWYCTTAESNTKPTWTSLGGSDIVQLSALPAEKDGVVLFAINKDRTVFRKTWHGKSWTPAAKDWKELGLLDALFGPSPTQK